MPQARLAQIAMSVGNLAVSGAWYEEVLELVQAGGSKFSGELVEQVTGVDGADLEARWLLDGQECFQYELFKANNPPTRPLPGTHHAGDEGYTVIGIHVADFDATMERALQFGSPPLAGPVGDRGHRRARLKDPDGIIVEIMEDDVRQGDGRARPWATGTALRFVTIVLPDPDEAAAFLCEALEAVEAAPDLLHGPHHAGLWLGASMPGARVVWSGDIAIELAQFVPSAGASRPASYKLTDLGLLNVAFMFDDRDGLKEGFSRMQALGGIPNAPQLADFGGFAVMYGETRQRVSFEMLHVDRPLMRQMGFEPWSSHLSAGSSVEVDIGAPDVWGRLAGETPVFGKRLAKAARVASARSDRQALQPGARIELQRGKAWWLERVVAIGPEHRVVLCNERTGEMAGLRLSAVGPSRVRIEVTLTAVPGWDGEDEARLVELQCLAQKLTDEMADLFLRDPPQLSIETHEI